MKSDLGAQISAVRESVTPHYRKDSSIIDNIDRGSLESNTRELAPIAFANFPSPDTRDRVPDNHTKHKVRISKRCVDLDPKILTRKSNEIHSTRAAGFDSEIELIQQHQFQMMQIRASKQANKIRRDIAS